MTISKTTYISDIWKTFRDRISNQVSSVSTTGFGTVTIKGVYATFPDIVLENKDDYPIIVVESPKTPTESFTFGKTQVQGNIKVEVFSSNKEGCEKTLMAVIESIESYKKDLADLGIKDVGVSTIDYDLFDRGGTKVHYSFVRFNFKYYYTKTQAW